MNSFFRSRPVALIRRSWRGILAVASLRLRFLALLVCCGQALPLSAAAPSFTQQIGLRPGWNLISIQVGEADWPLSQVQAMLDRSNAL